MYKREEAKKLREDFWTTYGQYMSVILSADYQRVNWVNYKTGVKHLYFRMDVSNKSGYIAIEITHPDEGIRQLMFEQFEELKTVFQDIVQEDWEWDPVYFDAYERPIARIGLPIEKVSVFNKEHWPTLISFFKPRMIALDEFWSLVKDKFDIFK